MTLVIVLGRLYFKISSLLGLYLNYISIHIYSYCGIPNIGLYVNLSITSSLTLATSAFDTI